MKRLSRTLPAAIVLALTAITVAEAHHSFAMFDRNTQMVKTGTVQRWAFNNPHSWLYLNIKNEDGTETRSLTPEDFTRYGAGITLSRAITDKLRAALLYDWLKKTSDFAAYEYTQNRLVLTLSYQF